MGVRYAELSPDPASARGALAGLRERFGEATGAGPGFWEEKAVTGARYVTLVRLEKVRPIEALPCGKPTPIPSRPKADQK